MAGLGEALALLLLSPVVISFTARRPAWDELYFFHRAACIRNAMQELSLTMANHCMNDMFKSPIMMATLLPAGPLHGVEGLAVAPITLSLATFALLWLGLRMVQRAGVRLPVVVAAAGIAILAPPLTTGAPFLVDSICAVVILDTLLLIPLETATEPGTSRGAFRRGLLWGLMFSLGLMAKLTYFYFAGVIFGLLLLISWRRDGIRIAARKLAGMTAASILPVVFFLWNAQAYWNHAYQSAFGPLTAFFNSHIQRWAYLRMSFGEMGWAYWFGIAALLCYALFVWMRSRDTRGLRAAGLLLLILVGYVIIATGSPNKDIRFFWPVWLSLPFCAALATAGESHAPAPVRGLGLAPVWLAIVLSVATAARFDMHAVAKMELVLDTLPHNHPIKVFIADDEAAYNIETLILARQLDISRFRDMEMGTVVYGITAGVPAAASIKRLLNADYVIFRSPLDGSSPKWANEYFPQFRAAVEAHGHLYRTFPGHEETLVYAMH